MLSHPYLKCSRGKAPNDPEAVVALYLGLRDAHAGSNYFDSKQALSLHWTADTLDREVRNACREDRKNSVHAVNLVKAQWCHARCTRGGSEERFDRRGAGRRLRRDPVLRARRRRAYHRAARPPPAGDGGHHDDARRAASAPSARRRPQGRQGHREAVRQARYLLAWSRVERTKGWIVPSDPEQVVKADAHFARVVTRKKLTLWCDYSHREGGPWTKRTMAFEFWGKRKRAPLLHAWRRFAHEKVVHRHKLVVVFLQCCSVESYNGEETPLALAAAQAVAHHNLKILALTFTLKLWALERSQFPKKLVEVKIAIVKIRFASAGRASSPSRSTRSSSEKGLTGRPARGLAHPPPVLCPPLRARHVLLAPVEDQLRPRADARAAQAPLGRLQHLWQRRVLRQRRGTTWSARGATT